MDPNQTLREIRRRVALLRQGGGRTQDDYNQAGDELAELVEALDEWLSGGGFLPEPWRAPIARVLLDDILGGATPEPADPLGPPDPAGVELPETGPFAGCPECRVLGGAHKLDCSRRGA